MDISQIGVLVRNATGAFQVRFQKGAKWTFGSGAPNLSGRLNTSESGYGGSGHHQAQPSFDREAVCLVFTTARWFVISV